MRASRSRTPPPRRPAASRRPSGLTASAGARPSPNGLPPGKGCARRRSPAMSQTMIRLSTPVVYSVRPSSETLTWVTRPLWPVSVSRTLPRRRSHTSPRPSSPTVASVRPSALNASSCTRPSCRSASRRRFPVRRSRSVTLPSSPPRAARRPSRDSPAVNAPLGSRCRTRSVAVSTTYVAFSAVPVRTRRSRRAPTTGAAVSGRPTRRTRPSCLPLRTSKRRTWAGCGARRAAAKNVVTTTVPPPAANRTSVKPNPSPERGSENSISRTVRPVAGSISLTTSRPPPMPALAASSLPSGEKSRLTMGPSTWIGRPILRRDRGSKRTRVPLSPPVASIRPSGLSASA